MDALRVVTLTLFVGSRGLFDRISGQPLRRRSRSRYLSL